MRPLLNMTLALVALSGPLLLPLHAVAQTPPPPLDYTTLPKVTAQIVVDSLRIPAGAKHSMDRTDSQWKEYDQAHAYLRGVQDSLSVKWCPPAGLKNLEVHGEILAYLAQLPPTARQGDASPLIADALLARYPCSKRKER
jgi:hypothetical protein